MKPAPARLSNQFERLTRIEPGEQHAALASFLLVFVLMTAYFILRPVRDAMASDWSDAELSLVWSTTFAASLVVVSIYGAIANHVRTSRLVPGVYAFFALTFIAFRLVLGDMHGSPLAAKTFYVFLSVFSLFHVSVFWSLVASTFRAGQARRVFAFIATGSSAGAIAGPLVAVVLAESVGTGNLLFIAAALLVLALPIVFRLVRLPARDPNADEPPDLQVAGPPRAADLVAGFRLLAGSRMLLGIALFIVLYVALGSFVYFALKNLLAVFDTATRTRIWAFIDLSVNVLSIVTAVFVTGRLATRFGLATTLAIVPVGIAVGMLAVAAAPAIVVVVALQIVRRAGNYAITRPGREMLFTAVDRQSRFIAKPAIDIVVYRGGDMLTAWLFTALSTGLGLGLGAIAAIGAGVAVAWAWTGYALGRSFDSTLADAGEKTSVPAPERRQDMPIL